MKVIDVGHIAMPVGDVRYDDEVDENGEELVCCKGWGTQVQIKISSLGSMFDVKRFV